MLDRRRPLAAMWLLAWLLCLTVPAHAGVGPQRRLFDNTSQVARLRTLARHQARRPDSLRPQVAALRQDVARARRARRTMAHRLEQAREVGPRGAESVTALSGLADAARKRSIVLATVRRAHDRRAAELKRLRTALRATRKRLERLRDARPRLRKRIRELQEARAARVARGYRGVVQAKGSSPYGLAWPLNEVVTSFYGLRWGDKHTGIDIYGAMGQPVRASMRGRVVWAKGLGGYGNTVRIHHGRGFATLYAHLTSISTRAGSTVGKREIIGRVGCTGSCTGPHLHFEALRHGRPRDPLRYLP